MRTRPTPSALHTKQSSQPIKVVVSSLAGTTIEWYEFFIYGTAATLVFPELFFPTTDDSVGLLLSLSSFALAFIARPLGGAIFGHFGDRIGRKTILVVTLSLMGGATLLIGLLPTYSSIGVAAPILLVILRVIQGLSLGGEYGGAILMSIEHSRKDRRGFIGAIVNTGAAWGLLLATAVYLSLSGLSDADFAAWGWRIPFLLSVVLIVLGLVIRRTLEESPEFDEVKEGGEVRKTPILEVLAKHWQPTVLMMLAYASAGVTFYIGTVYSLTYVEKQLGMNRSTILNLVLWVNVLTIISLPFFGWLSDRIDRKKIFIFGVIGMAAFPYLWFTMLNTKSFVPMLFGFVLLFLPYAANYGAMPAFFAHIFPPSVRYTGMSLGYTLGTVISSAVAPIIATWLLDLTGSWVAIAVYMSLVGVISAAAALFLKERYGAAESPEPVSIVKSGVS